MAKKGTVVGIAILVWFLGSIIAMLHCFETGQTHMGIALIAQYFLVFGLIFLIGAKEKIGVAILLIGLAMLIGVGINTLGSDELTNILTEKVLFMVLFALIFVGSGICMIVIPICIKRGKLKRCTMPVYAECIEFKESYSGSGISTTKVYAPVWKYYFNGEPNTYCDEFYSNFGVPNIGYSTEILVNPKDVNDVYIKESPMYSKSGKFIGVCCLIGGGILTYSLIIEILENLSKVQ